MSGGEPFDGDRLNEDDLAFRGAYDDPSPAASRHTNQGEETYGTHHR